MRTATLLLALLMAGTPLLGQVKIGTADDGRVMIYNNQVFSPARSSRTLIEPRQSLLQVIDSHATRQSLDPLLVRAVIQVESGYNARAVSHKGAMGLMQLMPTTARELGVSDPFDPEANVGGGTRYLRKMLDHFDNKITLALAGYNAGPEAVRRYGGVPPYRETREYIQRVLRLYQGADFAGVPEISWGGGGRRTFLVRRGDRLVMTTTPPGR